MNIRTACCVFTLLATLLSIAQIAPAPTTIELNRLQGQWEGEGAGGKCAITITGNTLNYRAGDNWHHTTFTLAPGTNPQQLHATIKDSWPPAKNNIGLIVHAIIKIENGTLTLGAYNNPEEPPKTFDDITADNKYTVQKVQSKTDNAARPKPTDPKPPENQAPNFLDDKIFKGF